MRSSYKKNNYDEVFYAIVAGWRPAVCVELGVLDGYSAVAIGQALKDNQKNGVHGHLDCYDLFELYPFNHGDIDEVRKTIWNQGLTEIVTVHQRDAFKVHDEYPDGSVHLLHVDLSNTGETVRKIMDLWDRKITVGGSILFEGGTEERDQEDWMSTYNKEPMKPEIENNPIIAEHYVFATYLKWPGLTHLLKKN